MGNPSPFRLEAAGWGFWLVTSVVLSIPCVYVSYQITQAHLSREIPLAMGVIVAAVLAAFVTYFANLFIQRANARRRAVESRQSKKQNKKR